MAPPPGRVGPDVTLAVAVGTGVERVEPDGPARPERHRPDSPGIGQRTGRTGMVEMAMREQDCAGPSATAETAFRCTLNPAFVSWRAGIH